MFSPYFLHQKIIFFTEKYQNSFSTIFFAKKIPPKNSSSARLIQGVSRYALFGEAPPLDPLQRGADGRNDIREGGGIRQVVQRQFFETLQQVGLRSSAYF